MEDTPRFSSCCSHVANIHSMYVLQYYIEVGLNMVAVGSSSTKSVGYEVV